MTVANDSLDGNLFEIATENPVLLEKTETLRLSTQRINTAELKTDSEALIVEPTWPSTTELASFTEVVKFVKNSQLNAVKKDNSTVRVSHSEVRYWFINILWLWLSILGSRTGSDYRPRLRSAKVYTGKQNFC